MRSTLGRSAVAAVTFFLTSGAVTRVAAQDPCFWCRQVNGGADCVADDQASWKNCTSDPILHICNLWGPCQLPCDPCLNTPDAEGYVVALACGGRVVSVDPPAKPRDDHAQLAAIEFRPLPARGIALGVAVPLDSAQSRVGAPPAGNRSLPAFAVMR